VMLLRGKAVKGINQYIPFAKFSPVEHFKFKGWEHWTSPDQSDITSQKEK